jgi:hypothetical protein
VALTLDLRKYGVTRSDAPAEEPPPLVLPRAKVRLTLLLPVGSEEGEYEVRVVRVDGRAVAEATGRAELRDYVTNLAVELDLRTLDTGRVELHAQANGEERKAFPAEVR